MSIPKVLTLDNSLNFAHRGFTASSPENSLAAFQAAINLGVDGIELDVRVCGSGEVVVFHDSGLKRMTGVSGLVKNTPLGKLQELRFLYKSEQTAETIPTLEQTLAQLDGQILLNVEIKTNGLPSGHQVERKVIAALKRFGIFENTLVSSFNPLVMRRLRKIDPEVKNGFLINKKLSVRNTELLFTRISGAQAIHIEAGLLKKNLLNKIKQRNYLCLVWTVNKPALMRRFLDWGVTGIITDHPDVLLSMTKGAING